MHVLIRPERLKEIGLHVGIIFVSIASAMQLIITLMLSSLSGLCSSLANLCSDWSTSVIARSSFKDFDDRNWSIFDLCSGVSSIRLFGSGSL